MNRQDFIQLLWGMPFLGGFAAFILASIFKTGESALGIMIMLGILAGSITLLTYVLGMHYASSNENANADTNKNQQ